MAVERVHVTIKGDVGGARRMAEEYALQLGFDAQAVGEIAIVATELASNLVVHDTFDGFISIAEVSDQLGKGIEIVAQDRGPGISDVDYFLQDSASSAGSMGCGLGAVRRLMDEFDIYSNVGGENTREWGAFTEPMGTVVTARKWLVDRQCPPPFVYSANSRPFPGLTANGDSFYIRQERGGLLVAVADGLGHGPDAEHASKLAVSYVSSNHSKPLDQVLLGIHEALRGSRGAAVTLVRLRLSDRKLLHVGVGNVETRLYPRPRTSLIPRPGVLGAGRPPRPRVSEIPWPQNGTLVLFSDGISAKWDLREEPAILDRHVTTISHLLMQQYGRRNDDATVLVVEETSS